MKPNLLHELPLGFARTNPKTVASDFGKNAATSLGIQGINISELTSGIPGINVQEFTGLSGVPPSCQSTRGRPITRSTTTFSVP